MAYFRLSWFLHGITKHGILLREAYPQQIIVHAGRVRDASMSVAYLNNSQLFLDQFHEWQEVLPVQPILVQLQGWFVGGEDYHSPFP